MFKLILKFQDTLLEEYTFDTTPVTFGRREDNDVVIDNMAVSGHHAQIEEEDPSYYVLVDLESLNGTFLNQKKIMRERIFDGDSIIIGKHSLEFVDLRPEEEQPSRAEAPEDDKMAGRSFRDTVILDTQAQQELLAKQAAEKGLSPGSATGKAKENRTLRIDHHHIGGHTTDHRSRQATHYIRQIKGFRRQVLGASCGEDRSLDQQKAERLLSGLRRRAEEAGS